MTENAPDPPRATARVWLDVDLPTLRANFRKIAERVAPCGVVAVLKANAYGLGVRPLATALRDAGALALAVAELNEALALIDLGLPVQILGSLLPDEIAPAVEAGVVCPITDVHTAEVISRESLRYGRTTACHLLIDTGMGRLGILVEEAGDTIRRIAALPALELQGLYSHFPMAYRSGAEITESQIDRFLALRRALAAEGIDFEQCHIANSDAMNNFPRTFAPPFNRVRTGINLHGSFDAEGRRALDLKPVLSLKTRLSAIRELPAGMTVGYGCTYRLPKPTRVGTICAGYADGLPLALSNRGCVLIKGQPCHVLGRVSMDYTTVSLDQLPDAQCGDEVVCLGGAGPHAISVDDWAALKGTHAYEVICSFGSRVERRYRDSATPSPPHV